MGPSEKISDTCSCRKLVEAVNYKNKNKMSQSLSESMMGKKNHIFFRVSCAGANPLQMKTQTEVSMLELCFHSPTSEVRGAFQVKQ